MTRTYVLELRAAVEGQLIISVTWSHVKLLSGVKAEGVLASSLTQRLKWVHYCCTRDPMRDDRSHLKALLPRQLYTLSLSLSLFLSLSLSLSLLCLHQQRSIPLFAKHSLCFIESDWSLVRVGWALSTLEKIGVWEGLRWDGGVVCQ